jgi:hypothetical protein
VSTGSDGAGQSRWHVSSCHHALSVASALVYVWNNVVGIKARFIGAHYSTGRVPVQGVVVGQPLWFWPECSEFHMIGQSHFVSAVVLV